MLINNLQDREKIYFSLIFIFYLIYFFPYFYLGQDAHIMIHDNLDSNVIWTKLIVENKGYFNFNYEYPQMMGGLNRSSLDSMYNTYQIWFKFFGAYYGYVINKCLMVLIAFFGMFTLLNSNHLKPFKISLEISILVSILFSVIPYWSYVYSVPGLPFLTYYVLEFRKGKISLLGVLYLLFYAFSSSLILIGIFFMFIFSVILIRDFIVYKKINKGTFMALSLLSIFYIFSHIPLFYSFLLDSSIESSRSEYKLTTNNWDQTLSMFKDLLFNGHYHSFSLNKYFTYPVILMVLIFFRKNEFKFALFSFGWIFFSTLIGALLNWDNFENIHAFLMNIIPIQLYRICFLNSFFWYLLLAMSLGYLLFKKPKFKFILIPFFIFQLFYMLRYHELRINRNSPTFREFYSESQFQEIKKFINLPQDSYRVASVAIHPAIALYNGFYTIDGYCGHYPLKYKRTFHNIIKEEINRSKLFKDYFQNWGARCYINSTEIGNLDFINFEIDSIKKLKLNYKEMLKLNTQFIFSPIKITCENDHLKLLKKFPKNQSYWDIYVYKIKG